MANRPYDVSLVVQFIEDGNLNMVKQYVPLLVLPNAKSVTSGYSLIKIAAFHKKYDIYDFLIEKEKELKYMHMATDWDPSADQSYTISLVVEMIEKNNLAGVKKYVPSEVSPLAVSVRNKIPLKEIALYLKRQNIYDYLVEAEKSILQKRVEKFDICFENQRKMYEALRIDDDDFVIDILRKPDTLFCNADKNVNRELLNDFARKAHGKCARYIRGMMPTLLARGYTWFG